MSGETNVNVLNLKTSWEVRPSSKTGVKDRHKPSGNTRKHHPDGNKDAIRGRNSLEDYRALKLRHAPVTKYYRREYKKIVRPRLKGPVGPELDWSVRGSVVSLDAVKAICEYYELHWTQILGISGHRGLFNTDPNSKVMDDKTFATYRPKVGSIRVYDLPDDKVRKWTWFCMLTGIQFGKDNTYLYPSLGKKMEMPWSEPDEDATAKEIRQYQNDMKNYHSYEEKRKLRLERKKDPFLCTFVTKVFSVYRHGGQRSRSKAARLRRRNLRRIKQGNCPAVDIEISRRLGPSSKMVFKAWIKSGRGCSISNFRLGFKPQYYLSINGKNGNVRLPDIVMSSLKRIYSNYEMVTVTRATEVARTTQSSNSETPVYVYRTLIPPGLSTQVNPRYETIEVPNPAKGSCVATVKLGDVLSYGKDYWSKKLTPITLFGHTNSTR